MDSPADTPPFQQTDSLPNRVGRPGWDWHDDKKALREGIKRVYVIGAGASACAPYRLPTLKTLTRDLCNFLNEPERRILVDAIYETLGVDLRLQADGAVDFEELLNRLDPRALQYLSKEPVFHSMSELLTEDANKRIRPRDVALSGLREFLLKQCLSLAETDGPYDRLVCSMTERDAIVCFNWDVLLELAFRRQSRQFSYWDQPLDTVLLKPHGSISWFALLDREMLQIDTTVNWGVFANNLTYYMLYLKDPLGSRDLGGSNLMVRLALSQTPAIIPPIASKLLSVGGEPRNGFVESGHWRTMSRIWTVFSEFIRNAQELVVIGYSLPGTDAASIAVLKQFAPDSRVHRAKTLMVVDRSPQILERYRRLVHPNATLVCDDFNHFDPASV